MRLTLIIFCVLAVIGEAKQDITRRQVADDTTCEQIKHLPEEEAVKRVSLELKLNMDEDDALFRAMNKMVRMPRELRDRVTKSAAKSVVNACRRPLKRAGVEIRPLAEAWLVWRAMILEKPMTAVAAACRTVLAYPNKADVVSGLVDEILKGKAEGKVRGMDEDLRESADMIFDYC